MYVCMCSNLHSRFRDRHLEVVEIVEEEFDAEAEGQVETEEVEIEAVFS